MGLVKACGVKSGPGENGPGPVLREETRPGAGPCPGRQRGTWLGPAGTAIPVSLVVPGHSPISCGSGALLSEVVMPF